MSPPAASRAKTPDLRFWNAELRSAVDNEWFDHAPQMDANAALRVRVMLTLPNDWTDLPEGMATIARAGRFATAQVSLQALAQLSQSGVHVHLGEPIVPPRRTRPARQEMRFDVVGTSGQKASSTTLLAVIDDGCPFAHAALRRTVMAEPATRVVALWDQSQDVLPLCGGGAPPAYGVEWGEKDLNKLLATHAAAGHVDEAACYQDAGQDSLENRWTHGSHVLGRLAADRAWHAGLHGGLAGEHLAGDSAAGADIAFVQLAREALLTVSPGAIAFHAFNAIAHLVHRASSLGYQRLVIVLAYDSWLGPHDATSWFEQAVDRLIGSTGVIGSVAVRLVLPAGNSGRQQAHQRLQSSGQGLLPLHLFLAPDSELPTWVELWLPPSWVASGQLTFKSPTGATLSVPISGVTYWGPPAQAQLVKYTEGPHWPGRRQRVLLRFAATRKRGGHAAAPHGLWAITFHFETAPVGEGLAYVGRAGRLMYQTAFARQSRFVVDPSEGRTLSGLAGGFHVLVAGARYAETLAYRGPMPVRYGEALESIGPGGAVGYGGRPAPQPFRRLIDASVKTEEGMLLAGQLGMGARSGVVWRMTGTSVAAPTVGRWQADVSSWPPFPGSLARGPAVGWPWPFTTVAAAAP
jgi:hypothetical protein